MRKLYQIGNAPKSGRLLAMEAKELLQQKEIKEHKPQKVECGIKNPCVFGKHNPSFNKHNIN